ncbi:MAG: electron transport complex subunit RsxC [Actinomycetia bacterium]|nr:electron transport complex subunit RsxC [Actinomycetes bacterium]
MGILLKKKSKFRGLHLPENKITAKKPIEVLPVPEKVILPLVQNIGAPCTFLVEKGDIVRTGQKIADSKAYVSSPIHSSISGKVKKFSKIMNPATSQLMDAVTIESDGQDQWVESEQVFNINLSQDYRRLKSIIDSFKKEEILTKIREAGIVGLGGAAFPTHVKLNPPPEKKIDTLILNGCECEPFITSDHRVMLEYGRQVLMGLYIICRTLDPGNIYIAIEDNKRDAIVHMKDLIFDLTFDDMFKIVSLPSSYPMGAEKTLIKTVVDRAVPIGGLPMDVGVVVNNVTTAKAIYDAVIEGKPLISKVITVTGEFETPKNILTRIGTPIRELVDLCGIDESKTNKVIVGGPMMGNILVGFDFPIVKGANCVLAKDSIIPDERNCINCGSCVRICPMDLVPLVYVRNVKSGRSDGLSGHYIENCIECGSCAYVCPANIPIVGYIKTGKAMIAK